MLQQLVTAASFETLMGLVLVAHIEHLAGHTEGEPYILI
jgi:hypothetical protein